MKREITLFDIIRDPRFYEFEQAKGVRDSTQSDEERDGAWDEIEVLWYELIDDYDEDELRRWGIDPVN